MKVLHVNDHYDLVGGTETILIGTLSALEEQGVETVVVYQHPAPKVVKRRSYEVPHLGGTRPPRPSAVADAYREVLQKEQPDLIHLHNITNPDVVEASCCFRPTVQSVLNHVLYCPGGTKYLPFLRRSCPRLFGPGCLASAFLTHCNSIRPAVLFDSYERSYRMMHAPRRPLYLALSQYQASWLIRNGLPENLVQVLPPFTELPTLGPRLDQTSQPPMILFTGRIFFYKGLHLLLRALRLIRMPFQLLVAGAGPALEKARELTSKLGLKDRASFVGWANPQQHRSYYSQAAMVVLPSIWPEPFGLVGIEAMSYAKPVVAFRVGGIPEWLEDGVTGFLVPPEDVKSLAERISYLLEHPTQAQEMGRAGRERVEQFFSKEVYIRQLLKIYGELTLASR